MEIKHLVEKSHRVAKEKPFGVIYKAINTINKKVYIGQTTRCFDRRKKQHIISSKNGSKVKFHLAINKYGEENFCWEILCDCYDLKQLNIMEEFYIWKLNSTNKEYGYNIKFGGGNFKLSQETKNKIGEKSKGRRHSYESRIKMSESRRGENHFRFGKQLTDDHKKKLSIAKTGYKHSESSKLKMSISRMGEKNVNYGKRFNMSQETKNKISNSLSGPKNHMWGKKHSEETRNKMREKSIGRIPGTAKKVIDTSTGRIFNSAKEASVYAGINHGTMKDRLNGRRTNKTTYKYYEDQTNN
jgi:group I intron endonuclease